MKFLWKAKRQGIMTKCGLRIEGSHIVFPRDHLKWFYLSGVMFGMSFIGVITSRYTDAKEKDDAEV